uniref:Transcription initiation protein SPT3 homolog n=1 Tax=Parascaris univalens TaxID=6257 RepID=A0A915AAG8_PARUN
MSTCGTRGTSEGGDEQEELQAVVTNLMFAYGDAQEPLDECQKLVMDILHEQMMAIVKKAEKTARERGSKQIQMVDVLFQFRRHPIQLNRIFQYLKSADVLRTTKQSLLNSGSEFSADTMDDFDFGAQFDDGMNDEVKGSIYGRDAQSMYQALSVFDVTGELRCVLDRSAKDDEEKMERMRRLYKRGAAMDRDEYQKYAKARMCSMCAINGRRSERSIRRFLNWLGGAEVAANTVTILSYIASEIICVIVEGAVFSQQSETRRLYTNDYPINSIQLRHYQESLRRNKGYAKNDGRGKRNEQKTQIRRVERRKSALK